MQLWKRKSYVVFLLVQWLTLSGALKARDPITEPLKSLRTEHPRLLFTQDRQREIERIAKSDALLQSLIENNRRYADYLRKRADIEHELVGSRLLTQSRR